MFTSCKPKKDDPQPDNKDTTNPVNKLPVANFTFASETINLKDDSVAVNVTNTSTNATSWYWVFKNSGYDDKKSGTASASYYYTSSTTTGHGGLINFSGAETLSRSVLIVAKNDKGDSSYVEKTFVIVDSRMKINISINLNPNSNAKYSNAYLVVGGKDYQTTGLIIRIPWYLLNSSSTISFALQHPDGSNDYYGTKSFQLSKDGINIVLTTGNTNTLTVDGINMLAQ